MPSFAITNLLLDVLNPRFETEQQNQRDAIHKMAIEQGEKLLNLAEDIVQFGMDPTSLPLVIAVDNGSKHIVVEGNRRIVALKLLYNPQLAQGAWSGQQEKKLKELSLQFNKAAISSVLCVVLPDREEADHWIQLRHRGEQNGRGIVGWDGHAIARYEQRRGGGRTRAALQAIDLVRQRGNLDQPTLERLNNVPVTTVQRLLNDPEVRKTLGVELKKGELHTTLPDREVLKGLGRIIRDAAHGRVPQVPISHLGSLTFPHTCLTKLLNSRQLLPTMPLPPVSFERYHSIIFIDSNKNPCYPLLCFPRLPCLP
jgi:hypothetical protein